MLERTARPLGGCGMASRARSNAVYRALGTPGKLLPGLPERHLAGPLAASVLIDVVIGGATIAVVLLTCCATSWA